MQYLYPFLISFSFIFFSELGDKTQILVLSFSSKNKAINILIGVAIGTLLSHGVAITFGSSLSSIGSDSFVSYLKFFTYLTFIIFGLIGFKNLIFKKQIDKNTSSKNSTLSFKSPSSREISCSESTVRSRVLSFNTAFIFFTF